MVLAALLTLVPAPAETEHLGKVVGIADGDTFTLLAGKEQLRIRLAEIDTPEKGQPYGNRARQALTDLIYGKVVRVVEDDHDRYGRVVGRVYVGSLDVNAEMVRRGAAWVYRTYARDHSLYELENEARSARRGIWALSEAEREPPWKWREERSDSNLLSTPAAAAPQGPVIGNRKSLIITDPIARTTGRSRRETGSISTRQPQRMRRDSGGREIVPSRCDATAIANLALDRHCATGTTMITAGDIAPDFALPATPVPVSLPECFLRGGTDHSDNWKTDERRRGHESRSPSQAHEAR